MLKSYGSFNMQNIVNHHNFYPFAQKLPSLHSLFMYSFNEYIWVSTTCHAYKEVLGVITVTVKTKFLSLCTIYSGGALRKLTSHLQLKIST